MGLSAVGMASAMGLSLVSSDADRGIFEGPLDACVEFAADHGLHISGSSGRIVGFIGRRAIRSSDVRTYDLAHPDGSHAGIIHRISEDGDRWAMLLRHEVGDAATPAMGGKLER